ncbi:selenocysteine-specific elongation factor-like [Leptonychotes weddellii]|uniref:Selenocysteine-specific elongation factor-like n=1 Tax=Leptonychotes weddellii TaxID=9713 RepID=A0A7F8QCJ7_LEPWE|nr:selenocysteine-specific elongation factor-like [Leptonychotes weddellii]
MSELIELLTSQISIPTRDPSGPLLMSVDHCFSIKGQGTVMTGTILSGSISLGDSVEIPALKVQNPQDRPARWRSREELQFKSEGCWLAEFLLLPRRAGVIREESPDQGGPITRKASPIA